MSQGRAGVGLPGLAATAAARGWTLADLGARLPERRSARYLGRVGAGAVRCTPLLADWLCATLACQLADLQPFYALAGRATGARAAR